MKTLTITLHDTDNCGSSLQSFALQKYLLDNGIDNEIIDYVPEYITNNGNKLKTLIRKIVFYRESKEREKKFKDFSNKFLKKTNHRFYNLNELKDFNFNADCFITGSDQLWNSMYGCGKDPAFYLNFVDGNKIAYAVSFGREVIPEDNLNIMKNNCKGFKWISVREKTSVAQIKKSFNGIDVDYVCDPVLLNDAMVYDKIKTKRIIDDKYILIYMAQIPNKEYMNIIIDKVKEKYDYKIVLIGSYRNRCNCDIQIRDVAPGEFLSLISNAEYIVSNSFHATMFSLIYNKDFLSILPKSNGARIKEILNLCGLNNNYLEEGCFIKKLPSKINYLFVNEKLEKFKNFSRLKLIEQLKGVSNEKERK